MIAGIARRSHGTPIPDTGGVGVGDEAIIEVVGTPTHCASDVHTSAAMPNIFAQLLLTQLL